MEENKIGTASINIPIAVEDFKIEMLDDSGLATEECDAHACDGSSDACEAPADCDDCGLPATPDRIVYVWTTSMGIDYFCCAPCLSEDDYARLQAAAPANACLDHDLSFDSAEALMDHVMSEHVGARKFEDTLAHLDPDSFPSHQAWLEAYQAGPAPNA